MSTDQRPGEDGFVKPEDETETKPLRYDEDEEEWDEEEGDWDEEEEDWDEDEDYWDEEEEDWE